MLLARGHMRHLVLRKILDQIGDHFQLHRRQAAAGNLDAQHVHALLALSVRALLQADRGEAVGIDIARIEAGNRLLEAVDLFQVG